jgi:ribonuclease P protein component
MSTQETIQRLTFNKRERLKSRKTIESLFTHNQSLKIYPFKLVWLAEPQSGTESLKMGVSVTKRIFKSAVTRNRIKRRMRECIRLNKHLLVNKIGENDIRLSFMLIYLAPKIVSYSEFDTKIKQLFIRLGDKVNNS